MAVNIEAIKSLSANPRLVEFSEFVLSRTKADALPDLNDFDLMKIPRLVPHVFILDVLNSADMLRVKYCGTKIDEFYGTNMSGKCIMDQYDVAKKFYEIEDIFWLGIRTKTPSYTLCPVHLVNELVDTYKVAETIMFPCSSDRETVDFTFGFADYYAVETMNKKCITLVE